MIFGQYNTYPAADRCLSTIWIFRQGTIDYKYPGQIRFETNTPSTVIFTSNGVRAWYYRAPFIEGEEGEVTESTAKDGDTIFIKFFDSLKNGLITNDYYEIKVL